MIIRRQLAFSIAIVLVFVMAQACGAVSGGSIKETGAITGGVFFDCNQDGNCNCEEPGRPDVSVRLFAGACGEELVQTVRTDGEGQFAFLTLTPGLYCVFPDLPPTCGGYAGNAPTTSISRPVDLGPGETVELVWFGYAVQVEE